MNFMQSHLKDVVRLDNESDINRVISQNQNMVQAATGDLGRLQLEAGANAQGSVTGPNSAPDSPAGHASTSSQDAQPPPSTPFGSCIDSARASVIWVCRQGQKALGLAFGRLNSAVVFGLTEESNMFLAEGRLSGKLM